MSNRLTLADVERHNRKVAGIPDAPPAPAGAAKREIAEIHAPFCKWLTDLRLPYIHARPDMESTIGVGVADFHVFISTEVVVIEAKSATGKMKPDQLAYKLLMEAQGFPVHVCYSLEECKELVRAAARKHGIYL